jgi:hypothetical protein
MAAGESGAVQAAARRLETALAMLEQRLARRVDAAGAGAVAAFDQDRAQLAADLDAARARERELRTAGEEASAALGQAIAEIRAALEANGAEVEPAEDA